MSDLLTYVQLGFRHIVDVEALDHILFLVALAAIYRWRDARGAIAVITAFTVGHSVTLALAVTRLVQLPAAVIEFLIPVTIVVTGLENLVARSERRRWYRPAIAGAFGLIHGAGFANYLNALFVDRIALPLFGFNVGIELGQVLVLVAAAAALTLVDVSVTKLRLYSTSWPAYRVRVAAVSAAVVVVAARWAVERAPW